MENTYRDVNIAIANEFSRLAEKFGVDVWKQFPSPACIRVLKILNPGPGVGGHCISVDPWFFVEAAPESTPLIYHSRQVNELHNLILWSRQSNAHLARLRKKIAALGLAYKPDVDDLRESPAVEVVHLLQNEGAHVTACEPFKPDAQLPGITIAPTFEDLIKEADALLFLVKHSEFTQLSPRAYQRKRKPASSLIPSKDGLPPNDRMPVSALSNWGQAKHQVH